MPAHSGPCIHWLNTLILANSAWAFSRLLVGHGRPWPSVGVRRPARSPMEFQPPRRTNTAWAVALLLFYHLPLWSSISASAIPIISDLPAMDLVLTAWSCAA